jgi:hypothetical protein
MGANPASSGGLVQQRSPFLGKKAHQTAHSAVDSDHPQGTALK